MSNILSDFDLLDLINLDETMWEGASTAGNSYDDAIDDSATVAANFSVYALATQDEEVNASDSIEGLIESTLEEVLVGGAFAVNQGWPVDLSSTASASDNFEAVLELPKIEEALSVSASFDAWSPLVSIGYGATASSSFGVLSSSTPIDDSASVLSSFDVLEANTPFNGDISVSTFFDAMDLSAVLDGSATVSTSFNVSNSYSEIVDDSLSLTEDPFSFFVLYENISENLSLEDSGIAASGVFIADSLFVYDGTGIGWGVTAESSLTLTDTIETILGIIVDEWLTLTDSQINNWNGREIVTEPITLYDIASGGKRFSDTIDESIAITDTNLYKLTITVLESLGFADLANALRSASESVSESMTLTDSPAHALSFLIAETLDVVDASSVIASFIHAIDEGIGLADAASLINRIGVTIADPLVFTETISSKANLYNLIYDTLALNVTVELNGEVWECYVLNTPKFLPSMYSGFDFNSYCVFEGRAFGANSIGIYELTGDTDAGSEIHTGVIFSQTDFDLFNQKKFRKGYLDISGTSPKIVLETERGQRQTYNVDSNGKVTVSSELKSKVWTLSIADFESLDGMKLIPIILTK